MDCKIKIPIGVKCVTFIITGTVKRKTFFASQLPEGI